MAARLSLAILLILGGAALPAAADTYKWVDANGVVNYSNTPPPESAAKTQIVAERVSVVATDPALGSAIAAMNARAAQRAAYEEADWQSRQRYMAMAQYSRPYSYPADGVYGGYGAYPVYGVGYYPYGRYVPPRATLYPARFNVPPRFVTPNRFGQPLR